MKEREKQGLAVILIFILLFSIPLLFLFTKKEEYSISERRVLKELPKLSFTTIKKGEFGRDMEEYFLDHFPFREGFRTLKAAVSTGIFGTKTENGLYEKEGYLVKMEYPIHQEMIEYAVNKFENIYESFLKEKGSQCYFAIIPDKNYFLADKYNMLSIDYEEFYRFFQEEISWAEHIDLREVLTLEDYYKTDTHWRQERLEKVAFLLGEKMGADTKAVYKKKKIEMPFYGVYAGQWSLPVEGESMYYLTNSVIEDCKVTSIEGKKNREQKIYHEEKFTGKDPYDLFLSGPQAIQIIENSRATSKKELIVFRDSFASSLIPLFVKDYAKITLLDIRYVQSNILDHYVEFKGQDVLFLYSSFILNQAKALR